MAKVGISESKPPLPGQENLERRFRYLQCKSREVQRNYAKSMEELDGI